MKRLNNGRPAIPSQEWKGSEEILILPSVANTFTKRSVTTGETHYPVASVTFSPFTDAIQPPNSSEKDKMMGKGFDDCINRLQQADLPTFPLQESEHPSNAQLIRIDLSLLLSPLDGSLWCNATWDTILCWPAIRANTSYTQPCPSMTGIDPESKLNSAWFLPCLSLMTFAGKPETLLSHQLTEIAEETQVWLYRADGDY